MRGAVSKIPGPRRLVCYALCCDADIGGLGFVWFSVCEGEGEGQPEFGLLPVNTRWLRCI